MKAATGDSSPAARLPPPLPRWRIRHPVASAVALAAAALVVSPLASLGYIALTGHSEIWPHLVAYVLPAAAVDTALLLAHATIAAVARARRLVTELMLRDVAPWLRPLRWRSDPIVAYAHVDA
jgi:iron(III) transport system permease protein